MLIPLDINIASLMAFYSGSSGHVTLTTLLPELFNMQIHFPHCQASNQSMLSPSLLLCFLCSLAQTLLGCPWVHTQGFTMLTSWDHDSLSRHHHDSCRPLVTDLFYIGMCPLATALFLQFCSYQQWLRFMAMESAR